jgi:outer membrane cobalamin receptor
MTRTFAPASLSGVASLLALGLSLCASPALAQQAVQEDAQPEGPQDAEPQAAAADDTIVVTGSRVARLGFNSPTPLTVVGQEQLQRNADTNVGEALNRLPSFRPQNSGAVVGFTQANAGSLLLDLRGLGAQRTLVLVDGRRSAPSTTQGTFDINLLPSNIVSRAEVVTGGASAAYGSDAVAGVVNLILNTRLEGLRAEAKFGISNHGDNEEYHASAAYGSSFANGRGHFVVAGEYVDSAGMGDCFRYDWCSPNGTGIYFSTNNPGGAGANGQPGQTLGFVHMAGMTEAGLINSGPFSSTRTAACRASRSCSGSMPRRAPCS